MPRLEQTVAYSISPVVPTTTGKLPKFATTGNPSKATDSVFAEADNSHQIIIGVGAAVNAAQVVGAPIIVAGENASGRGQDAIVLGTNAVVGAVVVNDGAIAIGRGAAANAKNKIRIGSDLAFGAGAGDDSIAIGSQVGVGGNGSIAIGRGAGPAPQNSIAIGVGASTNGTTEAIAIGHSASGANTGVNHEGIALGNSAAAGSNNGTSNIAIGRNASAVHALSFKNICIGDGAINNGNTSNAICIGAGATGPISNEVVFGDSLNNNHIVLFTIRTAAGAGVRHRAGADGSWGVNDLANANNVFRVDASAVADDMRLLLWDVTAAALKRVSRNAVDTAGAGFRSLRIPN